jgi:hypothetical protein
MISLCWLSEEIGKGEKYEKGLLEANRIWYFTAAGNIDFRADISGNGPKPKD